MTSELRGAGTIGLSARAAAADPALAASLGGIGLATIVAAPAAADILHADERDIGRDGAVLIDFRHGAPLLERGRTTTIRFGFDDMAFGHALIAALVRPAYRPAVGEPASAALLMLMARIAASDATVLVQGDTGTGKEGAARFIHAASPRAAGPFVAVNCAALPETMLEAMLFGHEKGSFTGAGAAGEGLFRAAAGGTLLLDEVAELPLALQAKLLRAIQEREVLPVGATRAVAVDARIVAAANRDLETEVAQGRFRADLYWRLNVMPLTLAPLKDRRLDVRAIAAALLLRHAHADADFAWPTAAALDRLMAHGWPGNVRELENMLQRALLLRSGARIEAADLALAEPAPAMPSPFHADAVTRLADIAKTVQRHAIEDALAATGGHRQRAAERLGISERTLRYRLADLRAVA